MSARIPDYVPSRRCPATFDTLTTSEPCVLLRGHAGEHQTALRTAPAYRDPESWPEPAVSERRV